MLFNGGQKVLFRNAAQECLDVFDMQLNCDSLVQLVSYDLDKLNLNQTKLDALCTSACDMSLASLASVASDACVASDFEFNGAYISVVDIVDLFRYKFDSFCLRNPEGEFCLMVEERWDVGQLHATGEATWPTHTKKAYPNWAYNEDGSPTLDEDGELLDDSADSHRFRDFGLDLGWSATDYYMEGLSLDWTGHGWNDVLEYDEYPLEIQCSECFLAQYKHGIESKWGEMFDITELVWDTRPQCDQNITRSEKTGVEIETLALEWGVSSESLCKLNDINCGYVNDGIFCAPLTCDVTVVQDMANAGAFIEPYDNITMTQFMAWNPHIDSRNIRTGSVVCVGPPGGTYIPASTTVALANPTSFITTAIPQQANPPNTMADCGKYYEVVEGDSFALIAVSNGLTFGDLQNMNPSIDTIHGTLLVGYSYCVALVNGRED
ncbi:hypothetical protein G7Z17_g3645 [Cylindrodendrum hubeiense]|uniref:LysM domain-containing protein n=1 Tax=Cylindrodendrum hubeiense TaxID=595255 RepID=A0A9P5HGF8_9HYPO|nr:hypothetical protein G7Z17_g3645 [Cylindrodendrum hubeiense]